MTISASAEVIRLKNGRTIWAEHVQENGTHVEYDIGDNSYAIPKSSVERIDSGGVPPEYASATAGIAAHDLPAFAPGNSLKSEGDLSTKIVHDGYVDTDALAVAERQGNPELAATAYFLAGKNEFDRGDLKQARHYFETALDFQANNPTILNYYAVLLVRTGAAGEALPYAERAARLAPNSPDALTVLGYAQFSSDHTPDAIRSWKRCRRRA